MDKLDIIVDGLVEALPSGHAVKILHKIIRRNNVELNPYAELVMLESLPNKKDEYGSYLFDTKLQAWMELRNLK